MAHPASTTDENVAPRLPFPAWVMLAYVAAGGAYRLVEVATGTVREAFRYPHMPLDTITGTAYGLFVLLVILSMYGVLSRRAWGRKAFMCTLLARYGMILASRIPIYYMEDWFGPGRYEMLRWVGLFDTIAVEGCLTAFLVSYLYSREVSEALGRSRAAPESEGRPMGAARLPLPAKLLAVLVLLQGIAAIAWTVPLFSYYLTSGFSLSSLSPDRLLMSRELQPFLFAALGLAGAIAGVGILWRQGWGRWLLIIFVGLNVLVAVGGCLSRYTYSLSSESFSRLRMDAWDPVLGVLGAAAYGLLLVSYALSEPVSRALADEPAD